MSENESEAKSLKSFAQREQSEKADTSPEADRSKNILVELERDREFERMNTVVALEIINRLTRALATSENFTSLVKEERLKTIVRSMQAIWPENDGRGVTTSFRLSAIDASMEDVSLRLAPMTANATFGHDLKGNGVIRLGLLKLLEAAPDELEKVQDKIAMYVVHEMEHVVAIGDEDLSGGENEDQRFEYLSHPGEMRAHAKMFAYYFVQRTLAEPFTAARMLMLMTQLSPNSVADWYYSRYANSDDGARREVAERMANLTEWFVDHLRALR